MQLIFLVLLVFYRSKKVAAVAAAVTATLVELPTVFVFIGAPRSLSSVCARLNRPPLLARLGAHARRRQAGEQKRRS